MPDPLLAHRVWSDFLFTKTVSPTERSSITLARIALHPAPDILIPQRGCSAPITAVSEQVGILAFGPTAAGAQLEGSKAFMKDILHK